VIWDWLAALRRFLNANLGPLVLVGALIGPAWVTGNFERQRFEVICQTYRVELASYERDRAIATELGLPVRFTTPDPPMGCR
jgi:hypothetical protein